MALRPQPIDPVPEETARVARAAFPRGNFRLRLRDELGVLDDDPMFAGLDPARGQPALTPSWRLALVTVLQFVENLSDRQTAEAVRGRIDWKYALGLELADPGFDFSVLGEFRARLLAGGREEQLLLEALLRRLQGRGLLKARGGRQRHRCHARPGRRAHPPPPRGDRRGHAGGPQRPRRRRAGLACSGAAARSGSSATPCGSTPTACRGARPAAPPWPG